MSKNTIKTKILVTSALMIALSVTARFLSILIPFGGAGGLRIGFSPFFAKIPAFLFGPLMGGISCGLADVLGLLVKPDGAYIWALTLTAIIGGVICGFLWKNVQNVSEKVFNKVFVLVTSFLGIIAIFNFINVIFFKTSPYSLFLFSLSQKRYTMILYGISVIFILGILVCLISHFATKKSPKSAKNFMKLLAILFVSNLTVTTLNTFILMAFIPSLGKVGFWIFYIPRLIEEIIITVIQCFVTRFLLSLYEKVK